MWDNFIKYWWAWALALVAAFLLINKKNKGYWIWQSVDLTPSSKKDVKFDYECSPHINLRTGEIVEPYRLPNGRCLSMETIYVPYKKTPTPTPPTPTPGTGFGNGIGREGGVGRTPSSTPSPAPRGTSPVPMAVAVG